MNIIQAIQAAENGALITNNFLKTGNHFLKYIANGVFYQYEIVGNKAIYKYEIQNFSTAEILSIGWEVIENSYFNE